MKSSLKLAAFLTLAVVNNAYAEVGTWTFTAIPQYSYTDFKDSPTRNQMHNAGIFISADYLERSGVTFGFSQTELDNISSYADIAQQNYYASVNKHLTPDGASGKVTLRGDLHFIRNNDSTNETDNVFALQPQISYLSFDKKWYMDLGYAYSEYGSSNRGLGQLHVHQITPTLGMGFNQGRDWLQLRYYGINLSNSQRAQNQKNTHALETKWTHYFSGQGLTPEQIQLGMLFGERLYGVDSDTAGIYNLSDLQNSSLTLGAQWKIARRTTFSTSLGIEEYETQFASQTVNYDSRYWYMGVKQGF